MKICPNCRRTYDDDGLNFCLDDGSVLTYATWDAAPTVVMDFPRSTGEPPPATSPAWNHQGPQVQPSPRKRSRAWIWVLGIFATLALVCGGGLVGFFVYVASIANSNANIVKTSANAGNVRSNMNTHAPSANSSANSKSAAEPVDLSGWVKDPTPELVSEYVGDEFFMTSKQKGYYYVLVAKEPEFSTSNVARVSVRNPDDTSVQLGYGLVFLSDTTPLENDYAFLIDTTRKRYRVVRHEHELEKSITAWTSSNLIKDHGEANLLEARSKADKIDLYINGQLASSVANKQGPKKGVPGLYVGDGAKIGFRELEVVK
jgi:hypothetical protein